MRRLSWLVALCFLVVLVSGPAAGAQQQDQMAMVSIENFAFNPPNISVAPGTTVTWVNNDTVPHTTTASDGTWDSETLQPGESFSFTFDTPGTFPYFCEIHPFMTGTVTVGEGGGASVEQSVPTAEELGGGPMAMAGT
jgi:plastocyanin